MESNKLNVTSLVESEKGNLYIDKTALINFLKDTYYPFDIELEGLMNHSDIREWVSPDKSYGFDSSDYNDHECGERCGNRLSFSCESISDTEFYFSALQMEKDPYRNEPYEIIRLLSNYIEDVLPEESFKDMSDCSVESKRSLNFKVSKLYFKEFRQAVLDAIHEHLRRYYWCDSYTERGFYCTHTAEEDKI